MATAPWCRCMCVAQQTPALRALGRRAGADVRRPHSGLFLHISFCTCWNHEAGTVLFEMMRTVLLAALLACAVASAAAAGVLSCALDGWQ